jgi:hypothetical protein
MLLRRFYIQENEKAPEPKQKKTRELKTDIIPLEIANKELIEEMGRKKKEKLESETRKGQGEEQGSERIANDRGDHRNTQDNQHEGEGDSRSAALDSEVFNAGDSSKKA